jgi:predicted nucleic acid-binding protein
MIYLLDVNALVALGVLEHEFHERVSNWISMSGGALATCSITELGFVRVLSQTLQYGFSVSQARSLLVRMKRSEVWNLEFLSDENDISVLPEWVRAPGQVTDGHLLKLAKTKGAGLATLDRKISGVHS